eukprot:4478762-Karenia_brevis.AAC.1
MEHRGSGPPLPSKLPWLVCVTPHRTWGPSMGHHGSGPPLPSKLPRLVCVTPIALWAPPWSTP